MDDPPPPPYEEIDSLNSQPSVSVFTPRTENSSPLRPSINEDTSRNEPPAFSSRAPQVLASSPHNSSAASCSSSRPSPSEKPSLILSYRIPLKENSTPQNVEFPPLADAWQRRGVSRAEWQMFLHQLFTPAEVIPKPSTPPTDYPIEKGQIAEQTGSYTVITSSSRPSEPIIPSYPTLQAQASRRTQLYNTLKTWNSDFFLPRSLLISISHPPYPKLPKTTSPSHPDNKHKISPSLPITEIQTLLTEGADPNAKPPGGAPPLWFVAAGTQNNNLELTALLLRYSADPDASPPGGAPVLWHVASRVSGGQKANLEMSSLLLSYGADADCSPPGGATALWVAAARSDLPLIELLLRYGADPDKKPPGGPSALWLAASRSDVRLLEMLLRSGADPDGKPPAGPSALWLAALRSELSLMEVLLRHGADPESKPPGGLTALKYALITRDAGVVGVLEKWIGIRGREGRFER